MSPASENVSTRTDRKVEAQFPAHSSEEYLVLKYFWGPSSLLSKHDGNCATGFKADTV